jgi:hypothetical protein
MPFVYGAVTPYGVSFQDTSTRQQFCNSVKGLMPPLQVPRPRSSNAIRLDTAAV